MVFLFYDRLDNRGQILVIIDNQYFHFLLQSLGSFGFKVAISRLCNCNAKCLVSIYLIEFDLFYFEQEG